MSIKPRILALYSPAPGSGKTEVAKYLVDHHGYTHMKFADNLKDMLRIFLVDWANGFEEVERMLEGDLKEVSIPGLDVTPRTLMQTLGTEWGRQMVHPNVWAASTLRRAQELVHAGGRVVIDDMRFPNEQRLVEQHQGMTCCVWRPEDGGVLNGHPSEGLLDSLSMSAAVRNIGTIEDLHAEVRRAFYPAFES